MATTLPAIPTTLPISTSKRSPSAWNWWSPSLGITGRLRLGISGRLRAEYAAYRTAAEKLQRGDPDPRFPYRELPAGVAVRRRVERTAVEILIGYLSISTFTG